MRRWRHALGWQWQRAPKLARLLFVWQHLLTREALQFADELDVALWPQTGYQGRARGTPVAVMTPDRNQQADRARAWDARTGAVLHTPGARQEAALCCAWPDWIEAAYPARRYDRVSVVVDHDG